MNRSFAAVFLMIAVLLASQAWTASAQSSTRNDWSAVIALPAGTKLSVRTRTGENVQGEVSSISDTALTIMRNGTPVTLQRDAVQRVHRIGGRDVGKSTLIGLGVGTGTGVIIGLAAVASGLPHESGEKYLPVTVFAAGGAIIGTATGAVVGLFKRKKELVYEVK